MGVIAVGFRGRTTPLASLIITLGLALLVSSIHLLAFGDRPHSYAALFDRAWDIGGVVVQPQYVVVFGVTIAAAALLTLGCSARLPGQALVACADSRRAAELVGINVRAVAAIAFAVSAALSALGWVLLTPVDAVNYDSDVRIAVNGFAAAAFGGLVSIRLALLGGLVLGVAEQLVVGYGDQIPGLGAGRAPVRAGRGARDHARADRLALAARGGRVSARGPGRRASRPRLAGGAVAIWSATGSARATGALHAHGPVRDRRGRALAADGLRGPDLARPGRLLRDRRVHGRILTARPRPGRPAARRRRAIDPCSPSSARRSSPRRSRP